MALPPVTGITGLAGQGQSPRPRPEGKTVPTPDQMRLQISNEPLTLIYRSALQQLNEVLREALGEDAIQAAADSGMDFSPEAVAERILSFATAGFGAYQTRHPDQGHNEQLDGFMALIRGAIEQGFQEARDILDGLGVLQGDIQANADRTYELIQEGLAGFEQDQREADEQ